MKDAISKARRTSIFALGVSSLAIASSPAFAQEQETDSTEADEVAPTGGNVIVVTAQFREQNLQDTPLAITAVTGAEMEAKSQNDLATVADSAPNVQIRPQASNFGPSVSASIRGIGQNDFNPAYEPGVGIYIDDVYYPSLTGAVFDTLDLERVEILRGPQGTLSGRNSIGGAIKLYSRIPNGDSSGFVEGTYGSRDKVSLRAAADFALTDTIFARISGVSKRQDGYVDQLDFGCVYPAGGGDTFVNASGQTVEINPAGGEPATVFKDGCRVGKLGGIDYQAVRGIVRFEPSSSFDFTVIADFTDDDRTSAGEVLDSTISNTNPNILTPAGLPFDDRFICGPFCNFQVDGNAFGGPFVRRIPTDPFNAEGTIMVEVPGENRTRYRSWGVSGQANLEITEALKLTSITGYREFDTEFYADSDISPARTGYGINNLSNWSFSQEVRLNIEATDTVFLTVGGYYFEQYSTYDSVQDLRYSAPYPLQFRQPDQISADAMAAFANASWEAFSGFNVNAGIRYTEESKDQSYFRYSLDGSINGFLDPVGAAYGFGYDGPDTMDSDNDGNTTEIVRALTGQTAEYTGDKIDWRIAVDYRFSDAVLAYASVATGFKGGGSNPRPFNAFQLLPFDPETLRAYEVGLKTDLFANTVRFNLAAFLNKYSNIQSTVTVCPTEDPIYATPSACRVNAGDADIKGVEAELTANPIEGLAINASISYLDFQFTEVAPNSGSQLDDPGTGAPKWKASAGVQYAIDLGEAGSLTPRFDVFYQDKTFAGFNTQGGQRILEFLPSFTTANARLTWQNEDEDLQIALEVTNVTDEYYLLSTFDQRGNTGAKKVVPARPREWAINVRKRF
jgi:iron complex outermembrane receptor protein